jgi:uncharacterized phage protein (TIGR02220 family)
MNGVPYKEIIDYLNAKTGKHFLHYEPSTRKVITKTWKLFPDISKFKSVVDVKCAKWRDDAKMRDFLRPITLFGAKFESYLNEVPTQQDKQNPWEV